jgi:antitoxin (DNA-binding transcriptional repressor) of toxin-antitoxin stability system
MRTLNVSHAKAHFSGIVRRVIKNRETVVVKTPTGYVQIVPFDVPDFVPPAERGSIRLTDREVDLANRIGETL